MSARIYSPAKNAMQSGQGGDKWVLEFPHASAGRIEPLMGYTSSKDMSNQIRLEFESMEQAIEYAQSRDIAYTVQKERPAKRRRTVAYADNFSYKRNQPWTH